MALCSGDDASRQAGGRFACAMRGAIGDHGGHAAASTCRIRACVAAWCDPIVRVPAETCRGSADPMKKGESFRPNVLY
ncbi:conserved hypothetical protein [Burkholderia latens]